MKYFFVLLSLFLAVILQVSFLPFLSVFGLSLNLVLVLVVFLISQRDFKKYWPAIIFTGLVLDIFSALPFGVISLSLVLTAYFIERLKKDVFGSINLGLVMGLMALGHLFYSLLLMALTKLFQFDLSVGWVYNLIYLVPGEIILSIIFASFIFYVFKKIPGQKQLG